jgi:hypothetical protein
LIRLTQIRDTLKSNTKLSQYKMICDSALDRCAGLQVIINE